MKKPAIWFPAKRYGWGWGMPTCWQGWIVTGIYLGLMILGPFLLSPVERPLGYAAFVIVVSIALFAVCWRKGEPPRWRWGGRED